MWTIIHLPQNDKTLFKKEKKMMSSSAHVISVHLPSSFFALFLFSSMAPTRPEEMNELNDMEEVDDTTSSSPRTSAVHFGGGESMPEEMKGSNRKKKRKKRVQLDGYEVADNANGDCLQQDPLDVLGWDLMMKILSNLDARSVALSLLVSRRWHRLASSDRLWSSKCEELWLGKAHIPRLSQVRGISKLAAYSLSVIDGKRTRIMRDDLCDHVWEFHFTKVAPEYWRNLDPYWKGTGPPMRRYFHQDGSQTADPGDRVWGGHECCFSIVTSFIWDGTIREHYVRINRWPRMSVSRKQDWSWEMSNHLFCYSSIPDASKEGGTGPLFLVM